MARQRIAFSYRPSANFVRFAGNRPPNVPRLTSNLWASYERIAGLPIEVGGSTRFVGDRFADKPNATTMKQYLVGDTLRGMDTRSGTSAARIDNLVNAA